MGCFISGCRVNVDIVSIYGLREYAYIVLLYFKMCLGTVNACRHLVNIFLVSLFCTFVTRM